MAILASWGNPIIKTPNIDAMAKQSAQMTNFYVSPVCSPTRACLMTGRYNYRTRVIDTFLGRSMKDPGGNHHCCDHEKSRLRHSYIWQMAPGR